MSDFNSPAPSEIFPHMLKSTIANLKALLNHYGIRCEYNEVNKAQRVIIEGQVEHDLGENANHALIRSLLAMNNLPLSALDLLPFLMTENTVNPVMDFIIEGKYTRGSGLDCFQLVADTLIVNDEDKAYRDLALRTWFLQCVAAADYAKNAACQGAPKFELVLVLQGEQGIGKSTWLKALIPKSLHEYFAENEHLDPNDTNSLRRCLSAWICEIGELDATFRKADTERLKAFLSQSVDKIRLPYDRAISNYKRRTSFCASVNANDFLVDRTGNRRYLPIAVKRIDRIAAMENETFLATFWKQMYLQYQTQSTAIWWCSPELEQMLIARHEAHTETSPIEDMLSFCFNVDDVGNRFAKHYTVTQLLQLCGVQNPTKTQVKEAKAFIETKGHVLVQKAGVRGYFLTQRFNE